MTYSDSAKFHPFIITNEKRHNKYVYLSALPKSPYVPTIPINNICCCFHQHETTRFEELFTGLLCGGVHLETGGWM